VQDAIAVDVLETTEGHGRPALDVCRLEHEAFVANYGLEVRVEELEHEVDVLLGREDIEKLG
jgi:hypothetical protein